jgi:ABC-type spermidine/putrescine transport system permease subunit I
VNPVDALRSFGKFWWDFLVGDTPEIFVGALIVIGVALALRHDHAAAITLTVVLTVALLAATVYRGRRTT